MVFLKDLDKDWFCMDIGYLSINFYNKNRPVKPSKKEQF